MCGLTLTSTAKPSASNADTVVGPKPYRPALYTVGSRPNDSAIWFESTRIFSVSSAAPRRHPKLLRVVSSSDSGGFTHGCRCAPIRARPWSANSLSGAKPSGLAGDRKIDDVRRDDLPRRQHVLEPVDVPHREHAGVGPRIWRVPIELLFGIHDHEQLRRRVRTDLHALVAVSVQPSPDARLIATAITNIR